MIISTKKQYAITLTDWLNFIPKTSNIFLFNFYIQLINLSFRIFYDKINSFLSQNDRVKRLKNQKQKEQ